MITREKDEGANPGDRNFEEFEKQPDEKKELERLKDRAEKSAGPERADLDREIRERSGTEE